MQGSNRRYSLQQRLQFLMKTMDYTHCGKKEEGRDTVTTLMTDEGDDRWIKHKGIQ